MQLAFSVAMHPGLVFVNTIFNVGGGVYIIIGNDNVIAESVCQEGEC